MEATGLSADVLFNIFEYLNPHQQARAGETCRLWHTVSRNEFLLRRTYRHYIGNELPSDDRLCQELRARWATMCHLQALFTGNKEIHEPQRVSSELGELWQQSGPKHAFSDGQSFSLAVKMQRGALSWHLPAQEGVLIQQNAASAQVTGRLSLFPPRQDVQVTIPGSPFSHWLSSLHSLVRMPRVEDTVKVLRTGQDYLIAWQPMLVYLVADHSFSPIVIERRESREVVFVPGLEEAQTASHPAANPGTPIFAGWRVDDDVLILTQASGPMVIDGQSCYVTRFQIISLNQGRCIDSFHRILEAGASLSNLRCLPYIADGCLLFSFRLKSGRRWVNVEGQLDYQSGNIEARRLTPDSLVDGGTWQDLSSLPTCHFKACETTFESTVWSANSELSNSFFNYSVFRKTAPLHGLAKIERELDQHQISIAKGSQDRICAVAPGTPPITWLKAGREPYIIGLFRPGLVIWSVSLESGTPTVDKRRLASRAPELWESSLVRGIEAVDDRYLILDLGTGATTTYIDLTRPLSVASAEMLMDS